MDTPRGIIVGTGRAGTYLHYGALTVHGAHIVAFVDINETSAREASERFGVAHFYTSLEEALGAQDVDFVSVCTGVTSHFPLAKLALERGVHVLLEKPMTATLEEADRMARIVESSDGTVSVVHNHKFYLGMRQARAMVEDGVIGDITHIYREWSFIAETIRMMEKDHWAHTIPGGRLFEANPHNLYLLYGMVGEFSLRNIHGYKRMDRWPHVDVDEFIATFESQSATITIKMDIRSLAENEYQEYLPIFFVITGTRGVIVATYEHAKLFGDVMKNRRLYKSIPEMIRNSVKQRLNRYPTLRDTSGNKVNIGVGSGHYDYMERYLGFLRGEYAEPPVLWDEAYFVEKMNERMGKEIERELYEH